MGTFNPSYRLKQGKKMRDKKIGVLLGGMSTEREISIKSGKAVAKVLRERGWNAVEIDVDKNLPATLLEKGIDVAWIALHGKFGEDGCVQGLLEIMHIPYSGSSVQACAISMDKITTKKHLQGSIVHLIQDEIVTRGNSPTRISLPCVVKDPIGGSSIGVWICQTEKQVKEALLSCTAQNILIEEYISGHEITVAVLDGEALPVVSIEPKTDFFDLDAKYTKGLTAYTVPAPIPEEVAINAQNQAICAYKMLGMKGIARADFIVPKDGKPRFLEINASPGMTETSLSPMAANAAGIPFSELVERILLSASLNE